MLYFPTDKRRFGNIQAIQFESKLHALMQYAHGCWPNGIQHWYIIYNKYIKYMNTLLLHYFKLNVLC